MHKVYIGEAFISPIVAEHLRRKAINPSVLIGTSVISPALARHLQRQKTGLRLPGEAEAKNVSGADAFPEKARLAPLSGQVQIAKAQGTRVAIGEAQIHPGIQRHLAINYRKNR